MIINENNEKIYRDPITGKEYLLMLCTDLDMEMHYDIITIFGHSEDEPIGEYVDHFFGATFCMDDDAQLDKEINHRLVFKGLTAKIGYPTAFYTGGGIWLSAMYTDATHYAVIGSDFDRALSFYDHAGEDDDTLYPCQNMTDSKLFEELDSGNQKIYKTLLDALRKEMH